MVSKGEMWVFVWNLENFYLTVLPRDAVPVKNPHFTLAHHRVSSSSVVKVSD